MAKQQTSYLPWVLMAVILVPAALWIVPKWAAIFKAGVLGDLQSYKDSLATNTNLDKKVRDQLSLDFDVIRHSVTEKNRFGFQRWLKLDRAVRRILADDAVTEQETETLHAVIAKMKEIQRLPVTVEVATQPEELAPDPEADVPVGDPDAEQAEHPSHTPR